MNENPNLGGAIAIVIGPDPENKTVLVLDIDRPNPEEKFPGGKIEKKDCFMLDPVTGTSVLDTDEKRRAVRAAIRELEEETGLKPALDEHGNVKHAEWSGSTYRSIKKGLTHYVVVYVDDFSTMKKWGDEGELVRTCTFEDISSGKVKILKYHKDFFDWYRQKKGV